MYACRRRTVNGLFAHQVIIIIKLKGKEEQVLLLQLVKLTLI
jgi:hypothetical protein